MHHFVAIGKLKRELESGNAQFGSKSMIFRTVWPWNLMEDLQKRWGTCPKQHEASFMHHFIIICEFKLELQSRNSLVELCPVWPWPLSYDLDLLHGHHFCHLLYLLKIPWWYDDRNIVKKVWQTDRQTDGQTERGVLRAALSQLKCFQAACIIYRNNAYHRWLWINHCPR